MGREVWGTYSVKDHTLPGAFLADLMFYDQLVLPIPEEGADADWDKRGWAPEHQAKLIEKLEEYKRVQTVEWEVGTWERERDALAKELEDRRGFDRTTAQQVKRDGFLFTRTRLLESVPTSVRGVTPIPTFRDFETMAEVSGVQARAGGAVANPIDRVVADMTLRFLVPKTKGPVTPADLELVLSRTAEKEHKKARDAFWHWARDYFGDDVISDQRTLDSAVSELADLVADLERAAKWKKVKTAGQYLFLVGSVTVAMMGGPLSPAGIAGIGLTVGRFGFDKAMEKADIKSTPTAALFVASPKGLPFEKGKATQARPA